MSINNQFYLLKELGEKFLTSIENKSWDSALDYSQEWSTCIQNLFDCLSSDQFIEYREELISIEAQHQHIKEKLIHFRAKTLTQLQDINKYHAFNKNYTNMDKM